MGQQLAGTIAAQILEIAVQCSAISDAVHTPASASLNFPALSTTLNTLSLPPATASTAPVTLADRSLAKNKCAGATCSGVIDSIFSNIGKSSVIRVLAIGAIALTRIP